MMTPLEIQFHGVEKSEAVEARIAEKVARLEKHFDRMTHCRVVVEAPHRHAHKGKIYQIKIEIGLPGQAPVLINNSREDDPTHEDVFVALRDAFDAARRAMDTVATRMSEGAKADRGRRRPAPNGKIGEQY